MEVEHQCFEEVITEQPSKLKKVEGEGSQSVSKSSTTKESSAKASTEKDSKMKTVEEEPVINKPPKDIEKLRPTSSPSFDPIIDAPFYKGQSIPFNFVTRSLSEIENCKG